MRVEELADELCAGDFGDVRLNRRARSLAEKLGMCPNASIPAAMKSRAEIEAAYRFFNNGSVTPEGILEPHIEATYGRVGELDFAVLAQDTTEIDLTRPQQQVVGAGVMDGSARRGAFYHPMIAFDSAGVPLGIVGQKHWTRAKVSHASKGEKVEIRRKLPIEEKESIRWLEGLHWAEQTAKRCPQTAIVCVGDSEADIYDLFAQSAASKQANLHLLVRAGQSRTTTSGRDWLADVRSQEKFGDQTVHVRARLAKIESAKTAKSARTRPREARTAQLEIRKATVNVRRPGDRTSALPPSVALNVVLCEEVRPPEDADAIRWLLVTTLPIETEADVQQVISCYCIRWQIEVYFRTLKSGCKIEERRFEAIERVFNALAFFSVIAWRVMYVCHLGRECPDMDCEVMFEPSEWQSVYAILGKPIPTHRRPSLNEVVRAIARLGGFMDRPKQEPGPQTLWIGLQRCYDLSNAWLTFGPGAKKILIE
jgi:hypothetical protein